VTLDGNEQYEEVEAVIELWRRIGGDKRLRRLKTSMLLLEQPIARSRALSEPIHALGARRPGGGRRVRLRTFGVFLQARALGYRGDLGQILQGLLPGAA
jgi:hypothetical protein